MGSGKAVFRIPAKGAKTVEIDIWGMGRFPLAPERTETEETENGDPS